MNDDAFARNLRRLCDFFGVEPHEILRPHLQFERLVQLRPRQPQGHAVGADAQLHGTLQRLAHDGCGSGLDRFCGHDFETDHWMAGPGRVPRTLVVMRREGERVVDPRTERRVEHPGRRPSHGIHRGTVHMLGDRIFLNDLESRTGLALTQTVLFPSFRNRVSRLTGLRLCGLYAPDDPALDAATRAAIRHDVAPGPWHLRARNG